MPKTILSPGIEGHCDERFAAVPRLLAEQMESGAHHGVAVAIRHRGEPVVDVWGGRKGLPGDDASPWTEETTALSFSTTKGPAAVALHSRVSRPKPR